MPKTLTVCVSLEPEHVRALDQLAREAGSRSAAVRQLLARNAVAERLKGMELAYRQYFSDPDAVSSNRELTQELLSASSWLPARPEAQRSKKKRGVARSP